MDTTGWLGDRPSSIPKHDLSTGDETIARLYLTGAPAEFQRLAKRDPGQEAIARKLSGLGYSEFLLQSTSEPLDESVQVVKSLRGNYVAFSFGQNPPVWSYTAALLNTRTDDWRAQFFVAYSRYLRAGALTELGKRVMLSYDDLRVYGSLLNMSGGITADMQSAGNLGFSILVSKVELAYEEVYAAGSAEEPTALTMETNQTIRYTGTAEQLMRTS